jgi:hypothetical protein
VARKLQTKYEAVEGPDWQEVTASLRIAVESMRVAKNRHEKAKVEARALLKESGKVAVKCEDYKFSLKEQAGRKSFDKDAFAAAHPNIDLDQYQKEGKPSEVFRAYGPKDKKSGNLDEQLLTLDDELTAFIGDAGGGEGALSDFDNLRDQAELYIRALENETKQLGKKLKQAHLALVKRVAEIEIPEPEAAKSD